MSMPPAITAIVPLSIDPIWAAVSTPRARPDTTVTLLAPQLDRQLPREAAGGSGGVACADHRDRRAAGQADIAADHHGGRRIVELGEQGRIVRVVDEQVARAELRRHGQLAFGNGGRRDDRRLAAAARRQFGQRLDRRRRVAETLDQLAIGDGADLRRADQPEARDRGRRIARRIVTHSFAPTFGSVPFRRRSIFSRCFHSTSSASASSGSTMSKAEKKAALSGALNAAVMPASEEKRSSASRPSQTTA